MNDDRDADGGGDTDVMENPATAGPDKTAAAPAKAADKTPAKADTTPFGDNWRDQIAAGLPEDQRAKAQAWLKNRASPYDVLNAGMSADSKISQLMRERVKIPTGKDDDPKEVAAYRKAIGVPEKPDGYKVELPKEYGAELTGTDKELLDEFLEEAHAKNYTQGQVDLAIQNYWAVQQRVRAAEQAQIARAQQGAVDELHAHFGKEYRPTVELINRMFETELSEVGLTKPEERREFLSQRFTNGMALGEYPPFVKMMAKIARERADDGAFVVGEGTDGVDIDKRIDDIIAIRTTNPKEYERMQPELQRLVAAQNRRKARGR